jgi:hypothetical protein
MIFCLEKVVGTYEAQNFDRIRSFLPGHQNINQFEDIIDL